MLPLFPSKYRRWHDENNVDNTLSPVSKTTSVVSDYRHQCAAIGDDKMSSPKVLSTKPSFLVVCERVFNTSWFFVIYYSSCKSNQSSKYGALALPLQRRGILEIVVQVQMWEHTILDMQVRQGPLIRHKFSSLRTEPTFFVRPCPASTWLVLTRFWSNWLCSDLCLVWSQHPSHSILFFFNFPNPNVISLNLNHLYHIEIRKVKPF